MTTLKIRGQGHSAALIAVLFIIFVVAFALLLLFGYGVLQVPAKNSTGNLSVVSASDDFDDSATALISDRDGDGIPDGIDNCPDYYNYEQTDSDRNGVGDACDLPVRRNNRKNSGENETPVCSVDEDCGVPSEDDEPFCSGHSVYERFYFYDCVNPGTPEASCELESDRRFLESCSGLCVSGECFDIPCYDDSDCDDGNPFTQDICQNPGQMDSQCIHNDNCQTQCITGTKICDGTYSGYQICLDLGFGCFSWSTITYCGPGYTCENGDCVPGECTNHCTAGERRCSGNGFQVCDDYNGDGCTEWGDTHDCAPGEFCENGECQQTCSNECVFGVTDCYGNGYRTCGNYDQDNCTEWSPVTNCAPGTVCSFGQCVQTCSNQCIDGSRRCDGNGFQICHDYNGDGCTEWSTRTPCGSGQSCENGQCVQTCQSQCNNGDRRCNGNGFQVCHDYDGNGCFEWGNPTQCGSGQTCQGGQCVQTCQSQCVDGQRICDGNGFKICHDYDGDGCTEWSTRTQCGSGQTCQGGQCVQTCSSQCVDGSRQCNGNGFQTCHDYNGDGCTEWSVVTQCGSGQTCQSGQCIQTCQSQCTLYDRRCNGNGFQICRDYNGDGCNEWGVLTQCGSGQTCVGGVCI